MEAVSRGASEAGGHVIGVTCDEIERWRPVRPNAWVQEEWRHTTMRERLFALIEGCDAAVALPGGIGTLAEVAVMWSHLQTGAISQRPLLLIGPGWQQTIQTFVSAFSPHIPEAYRHLITLVPDVEAAVSYLNRYFS
jgi:predicted Rossmann-fold nucleotide-binding protein